uniref:TNase-like domain-containing protein n=1 Tax=viral metagenome TaxID=1070528 RepID=A0A6C0BTK0_9ZZZZ
MSEIPTDAPMFSDCVNGTTVVARVVSVYDGDTIKVIFPLNNTYYKWNCRLIGVDTPELRTTNTLEKEHGYLVRDKLREKINNRIVELKCEDLDKYGRLLVTVICDDGSCNINKWLIDNDYAFEYDGGTKNSWGDYLESKKNV